MSGDSKVVGYYGAVGPYLAVCQRCRRPVSFATRLDRARWVAYHVETSRHLRWWLRETNLEDVVPEFRSFYLARCRTCQEDSQGHVEYTASERDVWVTAHTALTGHVNVLKWEESVSLETKEIRP